MFPIRDNYIIHFETLNFYNLNEYKRLLREYIAKYGPEKYKNKKIIICEKMIKYVLFITHDNDEKIRSILTFDIKNRDIIIRGLLGELNDFHYLLMKLIKYGENKGDRILFSYPKNEYYNNLLKNHGFEVIRKNEIFYLIEKILREKILREKILRENEIKIIE